MKNLQKNPVSHFILSKVVTNYLIFFSVLISLSSCASRSANNLEAKISGLGNDTLFVESFRLSEGFEGEPKTDTIFSKDDRFFYNSNSAEPLFVIISPKKAHFKTLNGREYKPAEKTIWALIKPGEKNVINGQLEKYYLDYTVEGSEFNQHFAQLRNLYAPSSKQMVRNELALDTALFNREDQNTVGEFFKRRKEIRAEQAEIQLDYIKKNPDKDLSAFLLVMINQLDTVAKYSSLLSGEVRHGKFKELLDKQNEKYQTFKLLQNAEANIQVGKPAPDFRLPSLDQREISLGSINDKFIVLDFWGSWCAPCIKGIPKMKDYYLRYQDRVEFIGIACKDTEEDWKKAVAKYELPWINVINHTSNLEDDVSLKYAVMGYPKKLILDHEKNIVGVFEGEGDDFYKALDQLLGSQQQENL